MDRAWLMVSTNEPADNSNNKYIPFHVSLGSRRQGYQTERNSKSSVDHPRCEKKNEIDDDIRREIKGHRNDLAVIEARRGQAT